METEAFERQMWWDWVWRLGQRKIDSGQRMKLGSVQYGHRGVAGSDQQHDLGASQNDGLSAAFDETTDRGAIVFARDVHDLSGAQLLINDAMKLEPFSTLRDENPHAVAGFEP